MEPPERLRCDPSPAGNDPGDRQDGVVMAGGLLRAAYIPFRPEAGYDPAVELGVAFLDRIGAHTTAIILAPQKSSIEYSQPLKRYATNRTVLTPLNSNRIGGAFGRPTLVYAPALKELELAMRYAGDQPIAVVEDSSFSCARWADEIGAINMVERRFHAVDRSQEHQRILERIDFAGNNGWGDAPRLRDLRRHLGELQQIDALNKDEVLAYQLVRGRHGFYESLTHLGKEIDKISRT
ncbi:hypothetical protein K7711_42325 [Nocardia sp. CA2R105]|uniref:hypothetical protein n=1 Tax=Nocardia coffeae TaxID=2873381 RepID=UPI001CA75036|nr:hypothetical protein [Nocardia coffeae]MBY8863166.1 hypothetical protein [Nocardia coffeae]